MSYDNGKWHTMLRNIEQYILEVVILTTHAYCKIQMSTVQEEVLGETEFAVHNTLSTL